MAKPQTLSHLNPRILTAAQAFFPAHMQTQPIPSLYSQLPWRACSTWTAAADPSERGRTALCTPRRTSGCPGQSPSPLRCCCSAPALRWSGCGPPWSAPSARTGCTVARCCSECTSTWAQNGEDGTAVKSCWLFLGLRAFLWTIHRSSYLDLFSS